MVQRKFRTFACVLTNHSTTLKSQLQTCTVIGWNLKAKQKAEIFKAPLFNGKKEDVLGFSASSEFLQEGDGFNFIPTVFSG